MVKDRRPNMPQSSVRLLAPMRQRVNRLLIRGGLSINAANRNAAELGRF